MKQGNKTLGLWVTVFASMVIGSSIASAVTKASDLALDCSGTYKVLSSKPYFISNEGTRSDPRAGTSEKIEVLSVEGEDCELLKTHYNIDIYEGLELGYGEYTGSDYKEAVALSKSRPGKVFPFKTTQHFTFKDKHGNLPLFPLAHRESAYVLGITKPADVTALYGTVAPTELSDEDKVLLYDKVRSYLETGNVLAGISPSYHYNPFINLAISLEPEDESLAKQYIQDLLLIFTNITRLKSSFTSFSPGVQFGTKINQLLNKHGESKWATKLEILKRNPLLFESQIVGWAFNGEKAPQLNATDTEEFLEHALEQAQNLAKVPQVMEARYLLKQYKEAAGTIYRHRVKKNLRGTSTTFYELTPHAESLIEQILAVKWS